MRISIVGLLFFSATLASAGIVVDRVSTLLWFHRGIELAEEVKIHEGLPHPVFERDSYASERARDDTFEIAGDFLYEKPLEVPLNVLNEMLEMFYQRKVFNPPAPGPMTSKLCGGFHADHAFIWKTAGKRTAAALLCYGCREIRLIGPEGEQVTADLQRLAFDEFRSRLNKLRTQRPAWNTSEFTSQPGAKLPDPVLPTVDLPTDVAEKAVKEFSGRPVETYEFSWLESFLPPPKKTKSKR